MESFLNKNYNNLNSLAKQKKNEYVQANPFPHIVIDNLFNEVILEKILQDFPNNIDQIGNIFNNSAEKKFTLNDSSNLSVETNNFINYLNSKEFINFLQILTNIKETLIPDPYLIGGGLHELKNDGHLNIHADFNLHPTMKLDRRLNILIYLNKNWKVNYGGSLELWDKKMVKCEKKIIPLFNKTVIFSTTDISYHGNPEKIKNPNNMSRKSIAMYYYSNGRPSKEKNLGIHSTIFRRRPDTNDIDGNVEFKKIFGNLFFKKTKRIR